MEKLPTDCVTWAHGGRALAVGSFRCTFLWTRAGARVLKSTGAANMYALAFSPNGEVLACGSESKTVKLVTTEGKRIASLAGDSGAVTHLSFDPAGTRVLSGRALWDLSGKAVRRKAFSMIAVIVDGETIASAGPDFDEDRAHPALWLMTPEGREFRRCPLVEPAWQITTDGRRIAVGADGPRVTIFDARGEKLGEFIRHLSGHGVSGLALSGDRVASGGYGDTEIWVSGFDGRELLRLEGYARPTQGNGIAFAPHNPRLLAALGGVLGQSGGGDCVRVHDLEDRSDVWLHATLESWLAVDDRGHFVGDKSLSDGATTEDPSLLTRIFS